MVHDFLYNQFGFTPGSNYDGYNPGLQNINQSLCDRAGSIVISAYFNLGVKGINGIWNGDLKNIDNPSCR